MRGFILYLVLAMSCLAGDWQATGAAGFGMYHPITFGAPAGSAAAGIGPRYVLNAAIGRRIAERFVLEAAYLYQDGDFELKSGNSKTAFDANAHALDAGLLWRLRPLKTRLRPYLAGGAGAKFYHGGEIPGPRPLSQFGAFRNGTDSRPLVTFGGGLEWPLSPRWTLRLDLRDYTTPFPASVIVPAPGVRISGWLHSFVPTLGFTLK